MLLNNIALERRNIEVFLSIFERSLCVGKTVKALSLSRLMRVPVIEEEVVQKSCPCTRSLIKVEKLAEPVVEL